jgi:hypothetical protein
MTHTEEALASSSELAYYSSPVARMTNNILILYCYYEKNNIYKNNLELFLKFGLYNECDYLFIINDNLSVKIPEQNNIKVMFRKNEDYDFGAYNHALTTIDTNKYSYYFFINTSVRGPFIPTYINLKWYQPFINLLKDDVKLVGTSINILNTNSNESNAFYNITKFTRPYTHVQTQMFAMDKECLNFLISKNIFKNNNYNIYVEFIAIKEILMSQLVLKNNWNISCIIPEYQNIDYRLLKNDINFSSVNGDPNFTNGCFGRTIHPYESIFIKINRNISINEINSISTYLLEK